MGAIKSDNPLDIELFQKKNLLSTLTNKINSFMTTYLSLAPKERARSLSEIQSSIGTLKKFIDTFPIATTNNSGTKFAFENLKASFSTLSHRWHIFESKL